MVNDTRVRTCQSIFQAINQGFSAEGPASDDFTGRGIVVKAFLAACLAAIVLAVIAAIVLNSLQKPADRAFTTPYTRVGD